MSESRNDRIREAVNIIESAEGARDRMLANIKRKAAEQAAGEDTYSTPALEKNIPFKRFVKWLIPIAACFVIVVIGTAERQKTNNTTDPLSATANPFAGVDNTVEPEPVYAEIIPRSVEECVNDIPNIVQKTTDAIPVEDANNLFFYDSIEAFLEAEKQNPKYGEESFFIPNLPPEEYQLVSVSKREDVYISLLYKVVNPADNTEKLSDYDAERRTILICQTYLSQNGLEMFIKNGFQETIFDGKSYYIWEEHADNDRERSINGYEIVFIKDGKRVFMYLPATESFENMMRYADPEKKIIGE